MVTDKNLNDLIESRDILTNAVKDFYKNKTFSYKTISVELRKLLCDTQGKKDKSLFYRLFPELRLVAINGYSLPESLKKGLVFSLPFRITFDGKGGVRVELSFDSCLISKNEWVKQNIIDSEITIEQFIRAVSDKEGAHSDPELEIFINKINSIKLGNGKVETYKYLIVAIGEYIALVINEILKQNNYFNN